MIDLFIHPFDVAFVLFVPLYFKLLVSHKFLEQLVLFFDMSLHQFGLCKQSIYQLLLYRLLFGLFCLSSSLWISSLGIFSWGLCISFSWGFCCSFSWSLRCSFGSSWSFCFTVAFCLSEALVLVKLD